MTLSTSPQCISHFCPHSYHKKDAFVKSSIEPSSRRRDGSLPSRQGAKTYQVTVEDPHNGVVHKYSVPEDRYVWHSMTDQGADIPASCRNGCCTTCAVKITSGQVQQDQALGLLKNMRAKGYALLCVSYPMSDIHCVLQDKDEVYIKQFGSSFEGGGVEWGGFMPEDD
ncbi:unnamed protein product [Agarophyton chilense]